MSKQGAGIHTVPPTDVYGPLDSNPQGLTQAEAKERLLRYGRNSIRTVARRSLLLRFASNFTHLMALLLWTGGAIGFLAHMPELGIAIWTVNFINGIFSFWQEYKAEKAVEALQQLLPRHVRVLRDGHEQQILAEMLTPGDVLLLAEGDQVSADSRLVQEAELRVDQSLLTGESRPVRKTAEAVLRDNLSPVEIPNLIFAGTSIASGAGKAVVFATGMNSEFGKVAHLTQSVREELSPLQQEMVRATKVVTIIAVSVGALFFILAMALAGVTLAESFIFAMGMIVAFVPEGMLPTVTLALAMGTQRMAKRNALIKRLSAVETLGCTTVICTDKTGTLTQNEMTVRELWVAEHGLTVTGVGYAPEGQICDAGGPVSDSLMSDLRRFLRAASLCADARLAPPNSETPRWTVLGDPTEAALRVAAIKAGIDPEVEERQFPRQRELPFNSQRKRMTTIHRLAASEDEQQVVAFVKGAPKEVLALCTHTRQHERLLMLDEEQRQRLSSVTDEYARAGLRVLAIAERLLPDDAIVATADAIERELTFLGLVGMLDPPRPEVAEAVQKCHAAGIRIVMITGDYDLTAESIARRIGVIRSPQPRVLNGVDLGALDDRALADTLRATLGRGDEVLFARVTPEHKLRVVSALQSLGHVVAVTGDGVNDAPALKKADIGVAMGRSGTDVAKEAADMILTDDHFASIVNAIEEGRAVYANIKKFITYIFTSNTPEAIPFILFAFSGGRIPLALNVMQILSIGLGTDIVPALALGAEPPEPGVMEKPPRDLKEHVITRSLLLRAYLWLGMMQSVAAMAAFYFLYWTHGYWGQWLDLPVNNTLYPMAMTMTLSAVVCTQIGNLFAQRTELLSVFQVGFFSNRLVWVGIASELFLLLLIVYTPVLQQVFQTAPLAPDRWLFLVAWIPALLVADELRKWVVRRRKATREVGSQ